MITGRVDNVEIVGAKIRGLKPVAVGLLGAALIQSAETLAERMRASLPARYRDAVQVDLDIGADAIHVGVYVTGREAHDYVSGFDGVIDISSYVRTERMIFGRPVDPITENVRAHQRHLHVNAHGDLAAIVADGSQMMADSAIQAANQIGFPQ